MVISISVSHCSATLVTGKQTVVNQRETEKAGTLVELLGLLGNADQTTYNVEINKIMT